MRRVKKEKLYGLRQAQTGRDEKADLVFRRDGKSTVTFVFSLLLLSNVA